MEAWGGQNSAGCVVGVVAEVAGDGDGEDEDDGDVEELKVVEIQPLARWIDGEMRKKEKKRKKGVSVMLGNEEVDGYQWL